MAIARVTVVGMATASAMAKDMKRESLNSPWGCRQCDPHTKNVCIREYAIFR